MADTGISALKAVELVLDQAKGLRCYLTGSAAAAATKEKEGIHGYDDAYHDVDLFLPSESHWIRSIQYLIDHGYTFGERMQMLWQRVLNFGTLNWHTNSMRLISPEGIDVNLIFKKIGRQPTASLSQVLETFDFGLLSMGWETEDGSYRDARAYQFPGMDPNGPLPLLPWRRESISQGHFREHQGLRTFGRAARYFDTYGYDGTLVIPDLVVGYHNAADYFSDRDDQQKRTLGQVYRKVALLLEDREWDNLHKAASELPSMDTLDEIYEHLIEP